MALATKCPHCNTIFRVAADQLKLRGGIVRCGACKEVFDGNAALVDTAAPAVATPAPAPTPAPSPLPEPAAPAPSETAAVSDAVADFSLDFDTSPDSFGLPPPPEPAPAPAPKTLLPQPHTSEIDLELDFEIDFDIDVPQAEAEAEKVAPAPATESEPEPPPPPPPHDGRREPSFSFEPEEHLVAAALSDREDVHDEAEPPVPAAGQESGEPQIDAAVDDTVATEAEAAPEAEDEPGFVRQGRRRERMGRLTRIGMAVGSVLLLAALLAQGLTTFRNQLAANVPQLKPVLVSACSLFGCRVDVPAQIEALSIEQGELQTLAENTFSYASILHNQGASAQAWPSIELTLNDAADKPVLRRVLSPRDYLAPTVDLSKGFAPHSEQAVKLYFELAQLKASGYHIAIFYP